MKQANRNAGLDYLRSLAILIVIFNHGLIGFFISPGRLKFEGVLAAISASAVISIEWLFVLSGFLIGTMMIRSFEKQTGWLNSARDFWLRRWFRTMPNYYVFVLINLLLVSAGVASGVFEYKYLVFSQNLIWRETEPHFFGESWSLALDEWFYLVMPIMIGILSWVLPSRKQAFITAALLLIVLPALGRLLHVAPVEFFEWDAEIRRITIYHLDATGWGVLAAAVNKWFPKWWGRGASVKAMFGVVCMALGLAHVVGLLNPPWMTQSLYVAGNFLSITLMAGGTFLVVPWLTTLPARGKALMWVVDKLSLYSYSIYLVHFPLIFLFQYFMRVDSGTPAWLVSCVVVAWLFAIMVCAGRLYAWLEKPVADMRESFTKRVDASPF